MTRTIAIHSFRGGTGKSNISANLAATLALAGKRVGIVDADIQSPGIHAIFGLQEADTPKALNDYLFGECEIGEAAYDVTDRLGERATGAVFLIPSSIQAGEITRILRQGYDVELLTEGLRRAASELGLDFLMIDTHPGLNEETLLSVAFADTLIVVLRPDQQDFQGTGVAVQVARQLDVPELVLIVNKAPASLALDDLEAHVAETYACPVAAVLPHSDEMMTLGSAGIFVTRHPDHPVTGAFRRIADRLLGH